MSHILRLARADSARGARRVGTVALLFTLALAPIASANPAEPAATAPTSVAKTAPETVFIAVRNLGGKELESREQAFEDLVASRISAGSGIAILSRNEAVKRLAAAEGKSVDLDADRVDRALDNATSALRLAQTLDASGLLSVSLISLGKETRSYSGNGVATLNDIYTLRVSWKLLEAGRGSGIVGDTETVSRTVRQTAGLIEVPGDLLNGLLDDAAVKVAASVRARLAADSSAVVALKAGAAERVKFTVDVSARSLFFPELALDKDGVLRISQEKSPVALDGVTVELDGAVIGSAPFSAPLAARPGLHRMRLTREGFKPWQGIVNLHEGFRLVAALEPDDATVKLWREQAAFISGLKAGEKLTDAEVALIRARAENMRNYGFKIDFKVDAKEFPENHSNNVQVIPGLLR